MTGKHFAWIVGGAIAAIVIIAGLWRLGWYVDQRNIQHRYENNVNSQQYQAGIIQRGRDLGHDIDIAQDPGQKLHLTQQFCDETQALSGQSLNNTAPDVAKRRLELCG